MNPTDPKGDQSRTIARDIEHFLVCNDIDSVPSYQHRSSLSRSTREAMQTVIRNTQRAIRRAEKKFALEEGSRKRQEAWDLRIRQQRFQKFENGRLCTARRNRIEDYELGPLAPRRDVGENKARYGSMSPFDYNSPARHEASRPEWLHIGVGDRVIVTRGREKGKIGMVDQVDEDRVTVSIKGINLAYMGLPDALAEKYNGILHASERGVPLEDVKLVYPLPDPETGVLRDVIIDKLEPIGRELEEVDENEVLLMPIGQKPKPTWTRGERMIPGTNIIIPWHPTIDRDGTRKGDDTAEAAVYSRTYRPSMLTTPMPPSVLDELRNPYSRLRERHDPEFIAKMEAIDRKKAERAGLAETTMRTPLQEHAALRAAKREEARNSELRELTPEQLAVIGEMVVAAREAAKVPYTTWADRNEIRQKEKSDRLAAAKARKAEAKRLRWIEAKARWEAKVKALEEASAAPVEA